MYYEINVSKLRKITNSNSQYTHYFATAKRSIRTENELKNILADFTRLFPSPEYNIIVTRCDEIMQTVDIVEILAKM